MGIGPFELLLIAWVVLAFWAVFRICRRVDWSPWLVVLLFIPLVGLAFLVALTWRALPRAGYSRWLVVLLFLPILNVVMLLWLAFRHWPEGLGATDCPTTCRFCGSPTEGWLCPRCRYDFQADQLSRP